ncbi:hypothetical protein ACFOVU_12655 [Nocardiopsis sediminis]|uniref:RING-type E3 ubiquitin transferase n=1 Tax=Nocardiopsis sediminis TaxID=1778267 RepID=A0ABV8FKW3_9ACTN
MIIGLLGVVFVVHAGRVTSLASEAEGLAVRGVGATLDLADSDTETETDPSSRRCAVLGRAVSADVDGPDKAPLSEEDSAWWRVQVHPRTPRFARGFYVPQTETSRRPFDLVEGDRRIRVEPDPAMDHVHTVTRSHKERYPQAFIDRKTPLTDRVKARFPAMRKELSELVIRRVDLTEWRVPEGAETTVVGRLTHDPATHEPVIRARRAPDDDLLLSISIGSDTGADEIRRRARRALWVGWAFIVFGFGFLLLGLPTFLFDHEG